MCTVTFCKHKDTVIITSNRDESNTRANVNFIEKKNTYYPQDMMGGTWFAFNSSGSCIVLLNGAFSKHIRKEAYRKSRGLIVTELIEQENPIAHLKELCLDNIEPFTLVIYHKGTLHEFRWDEEKKHFSKLNTKNKYIWSSSTLYNTSQQEERENWFGHFFEKKEYNAKHLWEFHTSKTENSNYGIMMKREKVETISTTQIKIDTNLDILHHDHFANRYGFTKKIRL